MNDIQIRTEFITLGQFLKLANCASTGGHAKIMLAENMVKVNGEDEARRGRKLYPGNVVSVDGCGEFLIVSSQEA
ncbi:RNA-binding protein S4 [Paenibacillus sp. E194]|jgi:ribosome-associated protein|uniref:RNA binding protein involved in ribosome maturation n=4 Tax=Paenibacillus TaxID=44249 RepID=A0A383RIV8_PAEAL|nr:MULTISPECIES: S4 domain-containing protein YaaA [Paenibacillus]EPY08557.1 YaaA [Paenibacillus alvei TS-15]EPY09939.1 YaaA [Paenibacillus alvei A6-6i-x]KJB85703.1 RNA-binding protein S4 [Paenibacillus sp. E194]MCM3289015.1 S4 domain-containing protein YaaA [Paenibacillus sp. MER 180]MCY9529078.1 S4 domain-containing protein YaaA [Paenibacillus alvei]